MARFPATRSFVLALGILLTACARSAQTSVTVTVQANTMPPASTSTFTPTNTSPPTSTTSPTLTQTPTPIATLTPTSSPTAPTPTLTLTPTVTLSVYVFPIQPADIATYQQGHHDYPATDILAPSGSAFVAVTDGVVDFVSTEDHWDPAVDDPATRGGLSVAIIGDDGVRYYGSHLSAIEPDIQPGVRVVAGQRLGQVGNTGNARGIAPHLHFGISPLTFPEDWAVRRGTIDPYPYLQAWAAGEMLTPTLP